MPVAGRTGEARGRGQGLPSRGERAQACAVRRVRFAITSSYGCSATGSGFEHLLTEYVSDEEVRRAWRDFLHHRAGAGPVRRPSHRCCSEGALGRARWSRSAALGERVQDAGGFALGDVPLQDPPARADRKRHLGVPASLASLAVSRSSASACLCCAFRPLSGGIGTSGSGGTATSISSAPTAGAIRAPSTAASRPSR